MNKKVEINEQFGFQKAIPWGDIKLYYVLELAKRYLLDPISWVERPSTMPECIKELNASPVVLLYHAHQTFFTCVNTILEHSEISKERIAGFDQILQDLERPIEIIRNNLSMGISTGVTFNYSDNGVEFKNTNEIERQERQESFAKTTLEAIQKMLNDLRYYSFLALGIRTTNSIVYDDHEKDIRKLEKRLKHVEEQLGDYNCLPNHLKVLIDGGENEGLIVYKKTPNGHFYIRNKAFCNKHPHCWLNYAKKRFEKHRLPNPNWKQLGDYIRKEDGTKYAQLSNEVKEW